MLVKSNVKRCIAFILCLATAIVLLNTPVTKSVAADTPVVAGVKSFQTYINNNLPSQYLGTPLAVDGNCGTLTKTAAVKLIQYYINTTYAEKLSVDGHFGPASQIAFNRHKGTIIYGETGFWVYILQGLLYCHGYNPNGFDGSYGSGGGTGCLNATNAYKTDNYIYEHQGTSGTVGVETMASLCWKSSLAQKTFYIRNKANGQYLYQSSATSVGLSAYGGSASQKWQFQFIENGEFRLVNMRDSTPTSGDYVYALNASSSTSVTVQAGNTSLSSQRWTIDGRIDNFRLVSKAYSTKALRATSTTAVGLADLTSTNVRWELIEASNPYVLPFIENDTTVNKFDQTDLLLRMNCYAYIMGYFGVFEGETVGDMLAYKLQPGNISGYSQSSFSEIPESCKIRTGSTVTINNTGAEIWKDAIIERVKADLNTMYEDSGNVVRLYESSLNERIVGPWKKVALVLDVVDNEYEVNGFDYHWYIQHEDGKWSHKSGLGDAHVLDANGKTIYNPEPFIDPDTGRSNQHYGYGLNYSYFAGYYKIRTDAIYQDGFRDHSPEDEYKWDNAGDIASMSNSLPMISASSTFPIKGSIEYFFDGVGSPTGAGDSGGFVDRYSWKGDVDWFEFTVSQAGVYKIETQGTTDTYGALYRGSTLLDKNDDISYPTNNNFRLQLTLSPNILYRLRVSGATEWVHGNYYLTIEKQ